METNDLGNSCDFGSFDFSKKIFDALDFKDAVCNAIINLQQNYLTIKFIWVIPMKRFDGIIGEQVLYKK